MLAVLAWGSEFKSQNSHKHTGLGNLSTRETETSGFLELTHWSASLVYLVNETLSQKTTASWNFQSMVEQAFHPRTLELEAGGSLVNLRAA